MTGTVTLTTHLSPVPGGLLTTVERDGHRIDVSTIPAAFDHGGPETCLFDDPAGSLIDTADAVTRHGPVLDAAHRDGIDRAIAVLEGIAP